MRFAACPASRRPTSSGLAAYRVTAGTLRVTRSSSGGWVGSGARFDTSPAPSPCSKTAVSASKSLQEQIETTTTTTSGGKLVFHVFGALAEFECDLIRERTQAGLTAARARGRLGGRPKVLDAKKAQIAQALYHDKTNSAADICRTLWISRATL